MTVFLHGGYRRIISPRATVNSDTLSQCQAEVAACASDLSQRIMCSLIQAGSQVTPIGSDLDQTLVLHGLRRAHRILYTSTTVASHNLLCSSRRLGSSNVVAVCVYKIIFACICTYIPFGLYWVCRKEGYSSLILILSGVQGKFLLKSFFQKYFKLLYV